MLTLTRRHLLSLAAGMTASVLVPAAWTSLRPIDEEGFVRIGGIDQWVAIRGRDRSRIAILFLHGGPCDAQSPHLSAFAPWEERYVVAQWDQRGAGKTFEKDGTSTPNMTVDQIAQDAVEVAQYVIRQLGRRKLILVGHSWGALLGLHVIRLRPELFYAFIGTGQPVSGSEIIERLRSSAVSRVQAAGDAKAVAQLKTLSAPDLLNDESRFFGILVKWAEPFSAPDNAYLALPPARPNGFCLPKLLPCILSLDARSATELPIPFFVIQGRDDNRCPPEEAREFVSQVHAPAKGYTVIEGGHFAFLTNPTGFLNTLDSDMRRLGIR
jgi:pimeloyl-ACP methyl ester carboxylesterase